jgi:uncharacterized delta-60 repeat protein
MEERILKLFVLSLLIVGLGFDCSFVPKLASTTQLQTCQSWAKAFGGSWDDVGYSVRQTRDGGYILLGYTYSFGKGRSDFWLVKTNAKGEKEWDKTFGGEDDDGGYSIQQTKDGGYILLGYTKSFGSSDFWLIKTNAQGEKEWDKTFGGAGGESGRSVQQTSDGGYIFVGYSDWAGGLLELIKTDAKGKKEWGRVFDGAKADAGYSVQQTRDGGYILLGYTYSWGAGGSDFWLIKTNAKGEKEWDKTFGGENDDAGYSVQQTRDGGYILVGSTYPSGSAFRDVLLIKTDAYGNNQWSKTLGGDDSEDIGYAVQQTSDDGYIMLGSTRTSEADFWLVKYCPEAS